MFFVDFILQGSTANYGMLDYLSRSLALLRMINKKFHKIIETAVKFFNEFKYEADS
jgi:hypothetical protein